MRAIYYISWLCLVYATSGQIVESEVKHYVSQFKKALDNHLEDKLALSRIRTMIRDHEKELGIRHLNGSREFERIFLNIQLRFTDLQLSVGRLKSSIENSLVGLTPPSASGLGSPPLVGRVNIPPGKGPNGIPTQSPGPELTPPSHGNEGPPLAGPTLLLRRCCVDQGPLLYSGRFREKVATEECYEGVDDKLRAIKETTIVDAMKDNFVRDSTVKWQYFASTAGHYIQYPTNNRYCDTQSPALNSPLTEEWFVEKLRAERKNLILLVDNGRATQARVSTDGFRSHRDVLSDTVHRSLQSLISEDKVNVVLFPDGSNTTGVLPDCSHNLLVATPSNKNLLSQFVNGTPSSDMEPDLMTGLTLVYDLLEMEERENEASFEKRSNLVVILLDGKSKPTNLTGTPLLEMMARYQHKLDNSIQHLVYILGTSDSHELIVRMGQIADQNNLKIKLNKGESVPNWPVISCLVTDGQPVGKEGSLSVIEDIRTFPGVASTYFRVLPPKLDNSDEITTIMPILDNALGVKMTLTSLVYNESEALGVVAVDAAIGTVFTEIANFDVGTDSYMFLVDLRNGHVLMHPKLRDPDQTVFEDTVFPRLELIEPGLTIDERKTILNVSTSTESFSTTQLERVRMSVAGEDTSSGTPKTNTPATVYFRRLAGTHVGVLLVHFSTDIQEARLLIRTGDPTINLHAPYHRIDQTVPAPFPNKPDHDVVCHLYDNFVSFKESVIKLSPVVFAEPESYKYNPESLNDIEQINLFLIEGANTTVIRKDAKDLIQQTVRATNGLDALWVSSSKDVIDRFYGSTSGVFRLFPGLPLQNGFDHLKTDWYQRSIADPNTTFYHYGKLTGVSRKDMIIVSQAVKEQGRLQGVAGVTVTPRYFTSLLLNTVGGCVGKELQCHVVDTSGFILVDSSQSQNFNVHLAEQYPWLVKTLLSNQVIELDWCTGFSDGYHKLAYNLVSRLTTDTTSPEPCRRYRLEPVTNTNLFLLVLMDRQKYSCSDNVETCDSCRRSSPYSERYQFSLPPCQICQFNTSQCQCPCYCTADFDVCRGHFVSQSNLFPTVSCFNHLVMDSQPELRPESPGPTFEHCPIPCAAIDDLSICRSLTHCKLSPDAYPTCIWKDDDELKNVTASKFFPTTPIRTPPPLPTIQAPASSARPAVTKRTTTQFFPVPSGTATLVSGLSRTSTPAPSTRQTATLLTTFASSLAPPGMITVSSLEPILSPSLTSSITSSKSTSTKVAVNPTSPNLPPTAQHIDYPSSTSTPLTGTPGSSNRLSTIPASAIPSSKAHSEEQTTTVSNVRDRNSTPDPARMSTDRLLYTTEEDDSGLDGGQIAAITLGVLAVIVIILVVLVKVYGKKFRRPGAADPSKYLAGSSVFSSSFFNRSSGEVTLSTGTRPTVMYKEMVD